MPNIPQQQTIVQYVASSLQTNYTFAFYAPLNTDIQVYYQASNATPVPSNDLLELNVDYTVTFNNDPITGGYITLLFTPTSGYYLTINRQVEASLDTTFSDAQNFNGANLDAALDRLLLLIQQIQDYAQFRNLSYIINTYLPIAQPYTQLPPLAQNNIWVGSGNGIIAAPVSTIPSASVLQAQLANASPGTDGAGIVGYYNENAGESTTVRNYLNYSAVFGIDTGTENNLIVTTNSSFDAYREGTLLYIKVAVTNASDSYINVNSLGNIQIRRATSYGLNPLFGGELVKDCIAELFYDGTYYQLLNIYFDENAYQPNYIIGGNFDTNPWQIGTSFVSPSNNAYLADMWQWIKSGSGQVTVSKNADAPTAANAGLVVTNCMKSLVTSLSSVGATEYYALQYAMEGYDWANLAQQPFVISFWVKSSLTGLHSVALTSGGTDYSYVAAFSVTNANAWEYVQLQIASSSASGTWNYTNNVGLYISFGLGIGSNFLTSAGSWKAGNYLGVTGQVNLMATNGNSFKIALLQIDKGITTQPFKYRSPQDELALCQRYFETSYNLGDAPGTVNSTGAASIIISTGTAEMFGMGADFKSVKRAQPTITWYSTNNGSANACYNNQSGGNMIVSSTARTGEKSTGYPVFTLAITSNDSILGHWTADARL